MNSKPNGSGSKGAGGGEEEEEKKRWMRAPKPVLPRQNEANMGKTVKAWPHVTGEWHAYYCRVLPTGRLVLLQTSQVENGPKRVKCQF